MQFFLSAILVVFFGCSLPQFSSSNQTETKGRVEVMFHLYEKTLPEIAAPILAAKGSIDIAMHNLETSVRSPVIKALQSDGSLIIRMIKQRLEGSKKRQHYMLEGN